MEITENNIRDLKVLSTTKNLELEDGSKIEKGTEFILENFTEDGEFDIHFSDNKNNYYAKEYGAGYEFTVEQIKEFAEPTELAIENYEKKLKEKIKNSNELDYDEEDIEVFDNYLTNIEESEELNINEKLSIEQGFIPESEKIKLSEIKPKKLLNKLNVTNEKVLDRIEKVMVGVNNIKLKFRPVRGAFDFKHLNNINKFLYGSIYELPRISNEKISECKELLKDLKIDRDSKINNINEFADKTANHISKLYNMDIFEKGNINTLKEFTRNLGLEKGFKLDMSRISAEAFEFGCKEFSNGKLNVLSTLIKDNALNKEPSKEIMKAFDKFIELER